MTNLTILAGTDGGVRWLVNDSTGAPWNFTGWTVRAQVRGAAHDARVLCEWSSALGNALCDSTGYVTLFWTNAVSSSFRWAKGVYDIELTSPAGKISRLDSGQITVAAEVTR